MFNADLSTVRIDEVGNHFMIKDKDFQYHGKLNNRRDLAFLKNVKKAISHYITIHGGGCYLDTNRVILGDLS